MLNLARGYFRTLSNTTPSTVRGGQFFQLINLSPIFSSELEKAFDSVDGNFLFSVLGKFGFGPDFIQWVKILLCRSESCINNGCLTGYFRCMGDETGRFTISISFHSFFQKFLYRLDVMPTFSALLLKTHL